MKKHPFLFCTAVTALCYLSASLMFYTQIDLIAQQFDPLVSFAATGWVDLFQGVGMLLLLFLSRRDAALFTSRFFHAGILAATLPVILLTVLFPSRAMLTVMLPVLQVLLGASTALYFALTAAHAGRGRRTLCFALAYALGSLGTWLLSEIDSSFLTSRLVLIPDLLLIVLCIVLILSGPDAAGADTASPRAPLGPFLRENALLLLTIVLMTAVSTIGSPDNLLFSTGVKISSVAARAPYGIGLIAAALLYERSAGAGAVCTLASLIYPFLATILLRAGIVPELLCMLSYVFLGFFAVYRAGTFFDLTAAGALPPVTAVIGLAFSRLAEAAAVLLPGDLSQVSPLVSFVIAGVLFIPLLIVFFTLFARSAASPAAPTPAPSEAERRAAFAERYGLTRREEEVAFYLSQSKSNGEIAALLNLSENTVRFHVSNVLKKTGLHDRNEVSHAFHASPGQK